MKLITQKICLTKNIGIQKNLFGGDMLSFLDEAGAIFVSEQIQSPNIVTLEMDKVLFKVPVKEGNIIRIYGKVLKVGTTSIQIFLEARRYDTISQEEVCVCSTGVTFVKIDENNRPSPISEEAKRKISENK